MSLFENEDYRWRDTFFVLFDRKNRPAAKSVQDALAGLGARYHVSDVRGDEDGNFESLTLLSPYDYAAMDVSYVAGEDVTEQIEELRGEMKRQTLTKEEKEKLDRLADFDARFDVFHFEQIVGDEAGDDEDEFLDPGSLLIVLEQLADLCQGVGVDPQSGAVM